METIETISQLRGCVKDWRKQGLRVALVPTMGALHDGHLSLVREGRRRADKVVASIFVNPAQFAPHEDFSKYPRVLDADLEKLRRAEASACFAPSVDEIYPVSFATRLLVEGPAKAGLEDRFRPTHFEGVAVVVAKLLNQAQADVAVFGEKDFQQLKVIEHMARDLDIATQIVGAPTVREADGLAMSSRNLYLNAEERARAPVLYAALEEAAQKLQRRESMEQTMRIACERVAAAGFDIDYIEARSAETLKNIADLTNKSLRILAAARMGRTRLIDNVAVSL